MLCISAESVGGVSFAQSIGVGREKRMGDERSGSCWRRAGRDVVCGLRCGRVSNSSEEDAG